MYKLYKKKRFDNDLKKLSKKDKKKIAELLISISKTPTIGIGKPEILKGNLSGHYSWRINKKDRINIPYRK